MVKQGCTVTEAIAVLLTTYEQAEAAEIEKFDGQHYRKYRCPLPHVKAGASIQRYGRGARA